MFIAHSKNSLQGVRRSHVVFSWSMKIKELNWSLPSLGALLFYSFIYTIFPTSLMFLLKMKEKVKYLPWICVTHNRKFNNRSSVSANKLDLRKSVMASVLSYPALPSSLSIHTDMTISWSQNGSHRDHIAMYTIPFR